MDASTGIHHLTQAVVLSQVPDQQALYVMQRNGEALAYPVQVLFPGPCDGLRIKQPALPGRGTLGVIAFLNCDTRSGIWLGAIAPSLTDAISSPADSPFLDYESHWSGYWRALDETGSTTTTWPDGTQAIVGSGFSPTKHVQDASGKRVSVPRTAADYPTPPSPLAMTINHKSGASVEITAAGAVNLTTAAGQAATITANSGIVQIDSSGNVSITSPGTIHAKAPAISLDDGGTTQAVLLAAFQTWVQGHVHGGVTSGGANTGTPTTSPPGNSQTGIVRAQ